MFTSRINPIFHCCSILPGLSLKVGSLHCYGVCCYPMLMHVCALLLLICFVLVNTQNTAKHTQHREEHGTQQYTQNTEEHTGHNQNTIRHERVFHLWTPIILCTNDVTLIPVIMQNFNVTVLLLNCKPNSLRIILTRASKQSSTLLSSPFGATLFLLNHGLQL